MIPNTSPYYETLIPWVSNLQSTMLELIRAQFDSQPIIIITQPRFDNGWLSRETSTFFKFSQHKTRRFIEKSQKMRGKCCQVGAGPLKNLSGPRPTHSTDHESFQPLFSPNPAQLSPSKLKIETTPFNFYWACLETSTLFALHVCNCSQHNLIQCTNCKASQQAFQTFVPESLLSIFLVIEINNFACS